MVKCMNCGREFEAKRADARFCSAICRQIAHRDTVTDKSVTDKSLESVTDIPVRPANFGQPDCECRHCQQNRRSTHRLIINHGPWKSAEQLAASEVNRVSLPGDVDYDGCMVKGDDGIWRQKQTQTHESQAYIQ